MTGEFFTTEALGSFAGVTAATIAVGNAVGYLLNRNIKFVPFLVSVGLCLLLAGEAKSLSDVIGWVVAFVNGCLVFCTAAGLQVTALRGSKRGDNLEEHGGRRRGAWLRDWVK